MLDVLLLPHSGTRPKESKRRREVIRECLTNNIFDNEVIFSELKRRGLHGRIKSTSIQAMVSRECKFLEIYRPKTLIYFSNSNSGVFTENQRRKALEICQDGFEKRKTVNQILSIQKLRGLWISYECNRGLIRRAKVRYLKTGYVSKEMEDSK